MNTLICYCAYLLLHNFLAEENLSIAESLASQLIFIIFSSSLGSLYLHKIGFPTENALATFVSLSLIYRRLGQLVEVGWAK